jgi:hypothetical protein
MNYVLVFLLIAAGLFAGILILLEAGHRLRVWRNASPALAGSAGAILESAVFGLMSLLIAFTFNGAASRFDERRRLVVQETNAVETAYLRIDLLPADAQQVMRDKFRQYVDARLAFYRNLSRADRSKADLARSDALEQEIWATAVASTQKADSGVVMGLVLPALNQMIDLTTIQTFALETHPPSIVFVMLGTLVLTCSLIAGHTMAGSGVRLWLPMLAFAVMMTIVVYVILDVEFPRMGLFTVDIADRVLMELRQRMN